MFGIENYWVFLVSGIILNITPGNDTIYILARSISQGRRAGIVSVLGIGAGCMVHTILASLGLTVILSQSIVLFEIVKYIGVVYLVFMGIKTISSKNNLFKSDTGNIEELDYKLIFRQGFLTNLFNPKVALFFLSFLPQFINPQIRNTPVPFLILGGTFLLTGTTWCFFIAYAASSLSSFLRRNNKINTILQKGCGAIFIALGLKLAFAKK